MSFLQDLAPADIKWAKARARYFARRDSHLVDDLESEALLALCETAATFRPSEAALTLRGAAYLKIRDALVTFFRRWYGRRVVHHRMMSVDPADLDKLPGATLAYNNVDADRWYAFLDFKLAKLPRRQERIMRQYLIENEDVEAIARTFRLHVRRIRQIIQKSVADVFGVSIARIPPAKTPALLARRRASGWRRRAREFNHRRNRKFR